ncbi:MAG: LysR family transcriptional regulator [Peptococcaceae bacterium]|nr:LysR family transcriptional regulator [Peptococcaceae bacterium]
MDIENLKIILKVAEYSSINKASLSVYKTQSQVSRIVRDFETTIDATIFERSTRGVHPTKEGEQILDYCEKIVDLYEEMKNLNKPQTITDYRGNINVYSTINIYSTTSEMISSFSNQYPHISININTLPNEDIISTMLKDDNALATFPQIYTENQHPYYPIPDTLQFTQTLTLPIVAHCKINGKIAQKYKSLSAKTLTDFPLINFNPYSSGQSFTSTLLHLMGITEPSFQYSTDDLRILQNLISKGSGVYVGVCPSIDTAADNIAMIPIRSKIKIGFGSIVKKHTKNEIIQLFNHYFLDWYTKTY